MTAPAYRNDDQELELAKLELKKGPLTTQNLERISAQLSPLHQMELRKYFDELRKQFSSPDGTPVPSDQRPDPKPAPKINELFSQGATVGYVAPTSKEDWFIAFDGTRRTWTEFLNTQGLELVELLGEGSFGKVWLARETLVKRLVAVKIQIRSSDDDQAWENFLHEVEIAGKLDHPNIVRLLRAERVGEYAGYMVYEYVAGKTLQAVIDENKGKLAVADVVEWIAKIADALGYVHSQGIVHRDVSTRNIMLDESGRPRLLDFGLSLERGGDPWGIHMLLGTAPFMSPEIAEGRSRDAGSFSDLFSIGSVLYYTLTGEYPFPGKSRQEVIGRIKSATYIPSPAKTFNKSIPDQLELVLRKSLAKDPYQRYATGSDFAQALRRSMVQPASEIVLPAARSVPPAPKELVNTTRGLMQIVGVAMICAAIGMLTWFVVSQPAEFAEVHVFRVTAGAGKLSLLDNPGANVLQPEQSLSMDWMLDGKPFLKPVVTVLIAHVPRDGNGSSQTVIDHVAEPESNNYAITADKLSPGHNLILICLSRSRLSNSTWNTLANAWILPSGAADTNLYGLVLNSDKLAKQFEDSSVILRSGANTNTSRSAEATEDTEKLKRALKSIGVRAAFGFLVIRNSENQP